MKSHHISREVLDDQCIDFIHLSIAWTNDATLQVVAVRERVPMANVGIDPRDKGRQSSRLQLHVRRDGEAMVQRYVPAMSHIQQPLYKLHTVWIRLVNMHVLCEVQDSNMLP